MTTPHLKKRKDRFETLSVCHATVRLPHQTQSQEDRLLDFALVVCPDHHRLVPVVDHAAKKARRERERLYDSSFPIPIYGMCANSVTISLYILHTY